MLRLLRPAAPWLAAAAPKLLGFGLKLEAAKEFLKLGLEAGARVGLEMKLLSLLSLLLLLLVLMLLILLLTGPPLPMFCSTES